MNSNITLIGIEPSDNLGVDRMQKALETLAPASISYDFDHAHFYFEDREDLHILAARRGFINSRTDLTQAQKAFALFHELAAPYAHLVINTYAREHETPMHYIGEFAEKNTPPLADTTLSGLQFSPIDYATATTTTINDALKRYSGNIAAMYAFGRDRSTTTRTTLADIKADKEEATLAAKVRSLAHEKSPHVFVGNLASVCLGRGPYSMREQLADLKPKIALLDEF